MSYASPFIDSAGLHIPTYVDILDNLIANTKAVYGADIYLENDSADYQMLSIFALKCYDTMLAAQLVYNSRSPVTAIGSALDAIVKLNGIARKSSSYSDCTVRITGAIGTVINNGVVQDSSGYKWDLPSVVTIGVTETVDVSAVCETIGAIPATAGSITTIVTPTAGWVSVINNGAAGLGQPVESDSLLRARQALSTKMPSLTLFDGTVSAIAAILGVLRYQVYENYTNDNPDSRGLEAHSIWAVVEGGSDQDIADAIYFNKSVGCGVNGTTTVEVIDPLFGTPCNIKFSRPTYVTIYVSVDIQLLSGGTTAHVEAVKSAIEVYLNSLQIGEDLTISGLYGAAMATMPNLLTPVFSIKSLTAGTSPSPMTMEDIAIDVDEVTQSEVSPESVIVTVVT